jgi:hypothetical protein
MNAKNASRDMELEAAEIERDQIELQKKLDAVGAANKWLRTSLSKERGRYVGERDVALLICPTDDPKPGHVWVAVLYTAEAYDVGRTRLTPTSPEWTGSDWRTALTSAVYDLVDHDVLDIAERYSDTSWFMFEDIFGNEVIP